jgi:hypothetical protein
MSTPTRESAADRIFDSLIERQATAFDVIRSSNDRWNRFNHSLIEGARQGGRDWTEVGRRWVSSPTDFVGVYESIGEAIGNQQARTLALAREWVEDAVQSQRETADAVRQGFGDAREVIQRVQERAPQLLRRNNRDGQKTSRATAES